MTTSESLLINSTVTLLWSAILAGAIAASCYLFRDVLTASNRRIAAAGVGYALTSVSVWFLTRVVLDGFHWGPVTGVVDLAIVLVFFAVVVGALTAQLAVPLWLLGQRTSAGPLLGLFVGTTVMLVFFLTVSYESGNLTVYIVGIYPLVMTAIGVLAVLDRGVRHLISIPSA